MRFRGPKKFPRASTKIPRPCRRKRILAKAPQGAYWRDPSALINEKELQSEISPKWRGRPRGLQARSVGPAVRKRTPERIRLPFSGGRQARSLGPAQRKRALARIPNKPMLRLNIKFERRPQASATRRGETCLIAFPLELHEASSVLVRSCFSVAARKLNEAKNCTHQEMGTVPKPDCRLDGTCFMNAKFSKFGLEMQRYHGIRFGWHAQN